jgi:hypothetical protein
MEADDLLQSGYYFDDQLGVFFYHPRATSGSLGGVPTRGWLSDKARRATEEEIHMRTRPSTAAWRNEFR